MAISSQHTRGEGEGEKKCFNCGFSTTNECNYCSNCGYAFACPSCGINAVDQAKFCYKCGNSLIPTYPKAPKRKKKRIKIPMRNIFDSDDPLPYHAMRNPPSELTERGISRHQWKNWMKGLKAAKRKAPCGGDEDLDSCCFCLIFCFPFFIPQCLFMTQCPVCNPEWDCVYSGFQIAHRDWLALVNSELEPKGCYMKILSRLKGSHREYRTLVIALTNSEIQKLKNKPAVNPAICPCDRGRVT